MAESDYINIRIKRATHTELQKLLFAEQTKQNSRLTLDDIIQLLLKK